MDNENQRGVTDSLSWNHWEDALGECNGVLPGWQHLVLWREERVGRSPDKDVGAHMDSEKYDRAVTQLKLFCALFRLWARLYPRVEKVSSGYGVTGAGNQKPVRQQEVYDLARDSIIDRIEEQTVG